MERRHKNFKELMEVVMTTRCDGWIASTKRTRWIPTRLKILVLLIQILIFVPCEAFLPVILSPSRRRPGLSFRWQYDICSLHATSSLFSTTRNVQREQNDSGHHKGDGPENEDGVVAFWEEEEGEGVVNEPKKIRADDVPWKKSSRWENLHPKVKLRIIERQQRKAIENKRKREPASVKKKRMMMFLKKAQSQKKRSSKVKRPIPFSQRKRLSDLTPGMDVTGTVISLTPFGAYVDVGTECDGLLHISQISDGDFIEHVREVFAPGDVIDVRIGRISPELKKLQLTMLPQSDDSDEEADENELERIALDEIAVDDELWGVVKRVTSYGAYVEVGAVVDGFLHFMDHPDFGIEAGAPPSSFMKVGQKVRVWVSDVDPDRCRIKLTANRPLSLPRLKRENRRHA